MPADDEPRAPRHIRRFGDPVPGSASDRFKAIVRADIQKFRGLPADVREVGRALRWIPGEIWTLWRRRRGGPSDGHDA